MPQKSSAKFFSSLACCISSFTVAPTLSVFESFFATTVKARSASDSDSSFGFVVPSTDLVVARGCCCCSNWLSCMRFIRRGDIDLHVQLVHASRRWEDTTNQLYRGSYRNTSRIVVILYASFRKTSSVNSQQRRKTPSVLVMPIPSIVSRVKRKGTTSGTGKIRPYEQSI
jgi:hypothetical protein